MYKTFTTAAALAALEPAVAEADTAELNDLYRGVLEGWNRGSGEAFAAGWAEDGHQIAFDGTHFASRAEIARFHDELFHTHLKGTRLVGRVTGVMFPAPDVAVLHARGSTLMAGAEAPAPERDSIQTIVAVRRDDEWKILAFHNTRIRPMGRDLPGTLWWLISDWVYRMLVKAGAAVRGAAQ
jgi:uncharacterized protein (TIGR02246 family)